MLLYKHRLILIILSVSMLIFTSCNPYQSNTTVEPISKSDYILGTTIDIKIYDNNDISIIDKCLNRIREIESKMTVNNASTSEIIALNQAAGITAVKVSPDTFEVLERGMHYSEQSKGSFDITIGSVVKLWNIGTEYAAVPNPIKLEKYCKLVDYSKLKLDKASLTAKLEISGMQVDLGAIAKGYAADEVAKILRENGVQHAIINLGGNVLTIGGNMKGKPWEIGIQNPYTPRGDYMGILQIENETIVTSGTYERYFEENGKIYHHILDAKTGYPIDNGLVSVSIITDKSIDGDGNSTSALLLGLREGMKFIKNQQGVEAIFLTYDNKVYITAGLKDRFIITNKAFTLAE